jgi:exodeoxyribonuclease VII large subunit
MEQPSPTDVDRLLGSDAPGPFPVGAYAAQLKAQLLKFARVQLVGEVWGVRASRARIYFELRDARGALPCSMWCSDYEPLGISLADGMRVVIAGGCDYYTGSVASSPSFTFAIIDLRLAGEGDLLAELHRLRKQLAADGLFEPQKRLYRPLLPRVIGVVTGESGKARDDILAGLHRRGWGGQLVWAFAPVQDRHAAPRIADALRALAATPQIEVVIIARGGGSLADLFAFCDESLCRTVALLRVPVISSVGHHTDRTLIDDVAAVACSTPTHAAQEAVRIDIDTARSDLHRRAEQLGRHRGATAAQHSELLARTGRLQRHGHSAVLSRARALAQLSRAPAEQVARNRRQLHQLLRELRATARRATAANAAQTRVHAIVLDRSTERAFHAERTRRAGELERFVLSLAAHDPQRTLARGYAMVTGDDGRPLVSAERARAAGDLDLRFADGTVPVRVRGAKSA